MVKELRLTLVHHARDKKYLIKELLEKKPLSKRRNYMERDDVSLERTQVRNAYKAQRRKDLKWTGSKLRLRVTKSKHFGAIKVTLVQRWSPDDWFYYTDEPCYLALCRTHLRKLLRIRGREVTVWYSLTDI